jgi:hypothetical protein
MSSKSNKRSTAEVSRKSKSSKVVEKKPRTKSESNDKKKSSKKNTETVVKRSRSKVDPNLTNKSKKVKSTKKVSKSSASTKSSGKTKKSKKTDKETKVRKVNKKPATYLSSGIGMGPARVKRILTTKALNKSEADARRELNEALVEISNSQTPLSAAESKSMYQRLSTDTLNMVDKCTKVYLDNLKSDFESEKLKSLCADKKFQEKYSTKKKEFNKLKKPLDDDFYKSLEPNFYKKLNNYMNEHDIYSLGKPVKSLKKTAKTENLTYNEFSRGISLINKTCMRLSSNSRNILASLMDLIVMQYARNGLINCIAEGKKIIQLRHVLQHSPNFTKLVSMDPFVRTLDTYFTCQNWVEQEKLHNSDKSVDLSEVPWNEEYDDHFDGYVGDICRGVKMNMQGTAEEKELYASASVSTNFKKFCSSIVYETILRVGNILKNVVSLYSVKTISDSFMYNAIDQIISTCGIDYKDLRQEIETKLATFDTWRKEKREKAKLKVKSAVKTDVVEDDNQNEDKTAENKTEVTDESDSDAESVADNS